MKNFLFPYQFKFVGSILFVFGCILSIVYIWFNFQLRMPVFAIYSAFVEKKIFTIFKTNVADELILILLISGLVLLVCTREKNEEQIHEIKRLKAFYRAFFLNSGLLLLSTLFVYGSGFFSVLIFNLISFPVLYLLFFYFYKK